MRFGPIEWLVAQCIINTKLKMLKSKLKVWSKALFGNVHYNVKTTKENFIVIQAQSHLGGDDDFK